MNKNYKSLSILLATLFLFLHSCQQPEALEIKKELVKVEASTPVKQTENKVDVNEIIISGLTREVHPISGGDKLLYRAFNNFTDLSIHIGDFKSGKTVQLAGPGSWNPIPSHDEKYIAFNQIDVEAYKSTPYVPGKYKNIRNDVCIMAVNGKDKTFITNDGQSRLVGWNEDGRQLIVLRGPMSEGFAEFIHQNETGYWAIDIESKETRKLDENPLVNKDVELKETKSDITKYNYSNTIYDIYFEGNKLFTTTDFGTESEWQWWPNIFKLNDNNFLITEFMPYDNKSQPFFGDDGQCNIISLNITNKVVTELIVEDITCRPWYLTVSPDKKYISFHKDRKVLLMSTTSRTIKFLDDILGKNIDPAIFWSKDSKYIYAQVDQIRMRRVDIESLFPN